MNFTALDWTIVGVLLAVLTVAALYTRRFATSVSGFLAANRCAGRYLISVAYNMAQLGVITLVWYFQQGYDVGFTAIWWGLMEGPAMIVMALTGWVIYRFRQTRAMTLAEFFEMRYSRRFRVFAGLVAFLSGIINYGIFPGVAARFFIALCGFPDQFVIAGFLCDTFLAFMLVLMSVALVFVFLGGQIAVMVTDFLQGVFSNLVFLAVILFLLVTIPWEHIADTLTNRVWEGQWVTPESGITPPKGESLVHPFKLENEDQFNVWYWMISVVVLFYGARGWQGDQGYNAAAKNAHEAKMAGILGGWRFRVLMLIVYVLPICIRTLLHHPEYAIPAEAVHQALENVEPEALRAEIRTPLSIAALLPAGLLGLMGAAMLGAFLSTNDTYLHSWGAIFIQDVVLPFRRKKLSPKHHLRLLKSAIFGVAVFAVLFSWYYTPNQYIAMFLSLTGAVFVGGAGSAIIGGLYWKRGSTPAAWTAMITGMTLSIVGIVIKQSFVLEWLERSSGAWWGSVADGLVSLSNYATGQVMTFWAIVASASSYVLVSMLGPRREANLDKLLHRGVYAVDADQIEQEPRAPSRIPSWLRKLGFSDEFTGVDRWVTFVTLAWPLVFTAIFLMGTLYCWNVEVSDDAWLAYWRGWTWFIFATGLTVMVWFTIGGFRNLQEMFRTLRSYQDDAHDDGQVTDD